MFSWWRYRFSEEYRRDLAYWKRVKKIQCKIHDLLPKETGLVRKDLNSLTCTMAQVIEQDGLRMPIEAAIIKLLGWVELFVTVEGDLDYKITSLVVEGADK